MNKKVTFGIIITIFVLISLLMLFLSSKRDISFLASKDKKNEQIESDIYFDVYSNENDQLKILVTAVDMDNRNKRF